MPAAPTRGERRGTAAQPGPPASGGRRRLTALPLSLVLLLTAAVLLRPQQLRSTLLSPRAWLLVLAVVLLTVVLRRVTRALPVAAGTALSLIPAVAATGVFLLPTIVGTRVSEDLDGLAPASARARAGAPTGTVGPDRPVRLRTADVTGIGHSAEGTASLVRLPDGELLVRLEDFRVDPGPDYRLHLVPGAGRESPADGVELGRLKGSSGDQNYRLSGQVPSGPVTVLVWCRAFEVPIAAATLP